MSALPHLDHALRPIEPDRSYISLPSLRASAALRQSAERSKTADISRFRCPKTNTVIHCESPIEHNTVRVSFADPSVLRVREQAATVRFKGDDGKFHTHTIDMLVESSSAPTVAFLDKPSEAAIKMDLPALARRIADYVPRSVAEAVQPLTEKDFPEADVRTAAHFDSVRRDRRTYVDDELAELAPSLTNEVSIRDICDRLGGGRVAFRPVSRAIFYGTLERLTPGLITPETIVRFSGKVMPDLDRFGPTPPDDETTSFRAVAPTKQKRKQRARRFSYRSK